MGSLTCTKCGVMIEFRVLGDMSQLANSVVKMLEFLEGHEGHEIVFDG